MPNPLEVQADINAVGTTTGYGYSSKVPYQTSKPVSVDKLTFAPYNPPDVQIDMPFTPAPTGAQVAYDGIASNGQQTGVFDFFGNLFGNIGSILPMLLIFSLLGKRGGLSKMLPFLLLLPMLQGSNGGSGISLGSFMNTNNPMVQEPIDFQKMIVWGALLPKVGTFATLALGGINGYLGQKMFSQTRTYRRRSKPRTVVINRGYTRGWRR